MKKYQNWLLPIGLFFLIIISCRKEIRYQGEMTSLPRALTVVGAKEWQFNTAGDAEGWTPGNATVTVSGGSLNVTTTGTDPLIISSDNLGINAPAYKYIVIKMKNNTSVTAARIFFTTTADPSWSQAKSKGFTIAANNSYNANYIIDMSTVGDWSGTIKQIRFDPLDPAAGSGQTVNIDYIGITQVVSNANEWWWDGEGDNEGWSAGNATIAITGGTLNLTTTGVDPLLTSPDRLGITNPATYKYIHVDMRNLSSVTSARIFFTTDADTVWNAAKSKGFAIKADTGYYGSYIVDMSTVAGWTGTIKQIRVDPLDPATGSGQQVKIDFIRITDNQSYRGMMSPGRALTAGDADTLKMWKANVMRWQIVNAKLPPTVSGYGPWLDSQIVVLDSAFKLCEPLGIKILIDMHYTPGGKDSATHGMSIFYHKDANDAIVAAWQKLATHYKGRSGLYGYDLINEPVQTSTPLYDARSTEITIGNAIRAIDRKTPIFISTNAGDLPDNFTNYTPVPLTNVVYEVHMYDPHEYTHQQLNPGEPAYTYPGMIGSVMYNKAKLTSVLDPVRNFQTNYNARIHVGEFSAVRWADGAATWLRDCIDIFEGYGWSWTYHAYREDNVWSLEYNNLPVGHTGAMRSTTPTDRYNQVVGYGLNLNK